MPFVMIVSMVNWRQRLLRTWMGPGNVSGSNSRVFTLQEQLTSSLFDLKPFFIFLILILDPSTTAFAFWIQDIHSPSQSRYSIIYYGGFYNWKILRSLSISARIRQNLLFGTPKAWSSSWKWRLLLLLSFFSYFMHSKFGLSTFTIMVL